MAVQFHVCRKGWPVMWERSMSASLTVTIVLNRESAAMNLLVGSVILSRRGAVGRPGRPVSCNSICLEVGKSSSPTNVCQIDTQPRTPRWGVDREM